MLRRSLVFAALAAWPAAAFAQNGATTPAPGAEPPPESSQPQLIEPANALEYAFVSALSNERMRPIFRRYLLETHVALALSGEEDDSPPREFRIRDGFVGGAIFTSAARLDQVLGPDAPRIIINGRAALTRLAGKNVAINPGLTPMLTLEPTDVAQYLATQGESSAGPTQ
jgi:hypothetical protein